MGKSGPSRQQGQSAAIHPQSQTRAPVEFKDVVFADELKRPDGPETGLGLSLVATLLEMDGGDVWNEASDSTGSILRVEIGTVERPRDGSGE